MRLLVTDDHGLFLDAFETLLKKHEPDSTIKTASDMKEALEILASDTTFDLVMLDLNMPDMSGMEGMKKVHEIKKDLPVALMSGMATQGDVQKAMESGAVAFFPKTLRGKTLMQAIHLVLTGERFFPAEMPRVVVTENDSGPKINPNMDIVVTPREREVLLCLVDGKSNKEIARDLEVAPVTVKLHVSNIYRKFGVRNRTQAALMAREIGLVS